MLALILAVQAVPPPPPPAPVQDVATAPQPPTDWTALPSLRWLRAPYYGPELSRFVRDEVRAQRCVAEGIDDGSYSLRVDMAVLVSARGEVRRIVPRAISCPTVEQYASGLVQRLARRNLAVGGGADLWHRTGITFAWKG